MTTYTANVHHNARHSTAQPSFWLRFKAVFAVRSQRKTLSGLEAHLLNDIGLTRETAEREAKRKLWDVPQHWLR